MFNISRAVGNLGAPLGPFDASQELEDSETATDDGTEGGRSQSVIVISADPLTVGLGLETGTAEPPPDLV